MSSEKTIDFLQKNYIDQGKLGNKCAKGGLYSLADDHPTNTNGNSKEPKILVLDLGLSSDTPSMTSGQILELSSDGQEQRVLVSNQPMPDGLGVDSATGTMFWTNMGIPGNNDGSVHSASVDGTNIQTVVSPGTINTPKQLAVESTSKKIYFSDREGLGVYRCNFDGSDLEVLIKNGNSENPEEREDSSRWCVGIAVAPKLGKFYWTQKGPSKGNKGRILCANINAPAGKSAKSRDDVECLLDGLPEPIDLEVDGETKMLYWTDRGEIPFGNSLNRAKLDDSGLLLSTAASRRYEVITRHLKEAIGLKLDTKNHRIYVTDLGGNVYQCDMDGKNKTLIHSNDYRAFTGVATW